MLYKILYNVFGDNMNKKGFIATTMLFSFFLIFVSLMLAMLANYAYNRTVINKINEAIIEELDTVE